MIRTRVFQTSLMSALLDGVYEGDLSVAALLGHGDFGLGTFDGLDGEMLILDGVCYRMRSDGTVTNAQGHDTTPFAMVTHFIADFSAPIDAPMGKDALVDLIDGLADSRNYLYAVRVRGSFSSVVTRSVAKQTMPYRPFREVSKREAVLETTHTTGIIAGFRTPLYERGIGVPGGHVHFIDDACARGGHVLDFEITCGTIEICVGTDLELRLPLNSEFRSAELSPDDLDAEVAETEN